MSVQPQQSASTALQLSSVTGRDRRAVQRHTVDAQADVSLLKMGTNIHCKLLDLSLGGCCLRTPQQFSAGIKVLMELVLRVRGSVLRLNGVSQWTDKKHLVGVRFVDMNARRTELLQLLIEEVEYDNKRKIQNELPPEIHETIPVASDFVENHAEPELTVLPPEPAKLPSAPAQMQPSTSLTIAAPAPMADTRKAPAKADPGITREEARERLEQLLALRRHKRYDVDSKAVIYLVNIGVRVMGRIQDLSPGGCRIRTDERFSVGIYVRAEVDFHLEGLPFRLPGVTQAIYDKHTIGIRFLDMSERKREQLSMLIEELKEIAECEREISELEEKDANDFRRAS